VRLSGPEAVSIAEQLVRLRSPLEHARAASRTFLTRKIEKKRKIDEALVTWFAAPNSYTSEDLVEIAAHGSPVVLNLLLRQAWLWAHGWPSRGSSRSAPFSPAASI
jgi:tRNA modification GTPase